MKKKMIIIFLVIIFAFIGLFLLGGLRKRTDVVLTNYSISEDGTKIKLSVAITSTIGYARDLRIKQGGDNKYILY